MNYNPKFITYCGPMWSSKTSQMLKRLERYELKGRKVMLFKPKIDDRYSLGEVITHAGDKKSAVLISDGKDLLSSVLTASVVPSVVAVDEAFMVKDISETLIWLFRSGVTVLIATLDISFKGKTFKEVEKMLSWTTEIHKCTAVCSACGRDAAYTYRKTQDDEDIVVGGGEMYEPRCFSCHPVINQRQE